jgi:hypothetical protein
VFVLQICLTKEKLHSKRQICDTHLLYSLTDVQASVSSPCRTNIISTTCRTSGTRGPSNPNTTSSTSYTNCTINTNKNNKRIWPHGRGTRFYTPPPQTGPIQGSRCYGVCPFLAYTVYLFPNDLHREQQGRFRRASQGRFSPLWLFSL